MKDRRPLIRASEIGQYIYCPLAWWLARVEGQEFANIEALNLGERAHRRHGRVVRAGRMWRRAGYALIAAGLLALLLLVSVTLLAGGAP